MNKPLAIICLAAIAASPMPCFGAFQPTMTGVRPKTRSFRTTSEASFPITGYALTYLGQFGGDLTGWIELYNGASDAGYIYLTRNPGPLPKDYRGGTDANPTYIVMHQRTDMLPSLLEFLRSERPIRIRWYQYGTDTPATFLESGAIPAPSAKAMERAAGGK